MFIFIFQGVDEIFIIQEIDNKDNTAEVELTNKNSTFPRRSFWLPVKAIRRLIPWLPAGAVVQVIDKPHSNGMDMAHDVVRNIFYFYPTF